MEGSVKNGGETRRRGGTEGLARRGRRLRVSVSPWLVFSHRGRGGFTLTEMMVAIAIVVVLALLGVPLATTLIGDLQGRGVTGATQLVQTTVALARDRALRDQAPYGLRLVRDEANPWVCSRIQYLQQPAALMGQNQLVIEKWDPNNTISDALDDNLDNDGNGVIDDEGWSVGGLPTEWFGLVRRGDHLRIDNTGIVYELIGPDVAPPDGIIDLNLRVYGWTVWIAAEPFPNSEGYLGSVDYRGSVFTTALGTSYQIIRQPVPAGDQEELVLPRGTVIDLLRTKPSALPGNALSFVGLDNQPGVAGVDDDGNGLVDVDVSLNTIDIYELGARGSDDVPPGAWPPIDILFSPQGQVTGEAGQSAVIFFWIGKQGATQNNVAEDLADGRLLSLYTRSGGTQPNVIDSTDLVNNESGNSIPDGRLDTPYRFAEAAFGGR